MEVTGQLERHQEVLVAAAEKQEVPRGAFTSDGKGVKALGVLPQTEALAATAADLGAMLGAGITALRWWMPWGAEVRRRLVMHDRAALCLLTGRHVWTVVVVLSALPCCRGALAASSIQGTRARAIACPASQARAYYGMLPLGR